MNFLRKRSVAYAIAAFIVISSTVYYQVINTDWPAFTSFIVGEWQQQNFGGYYYRFDDDGTGIRRIYPNLDEHFEWTSTNGNLQMTFTDNATQSVEEWRAIQRRGEILVLTAAEIPNYEFIFYRSKCV